MRYLVHIHNAPLVLELVAPGHGMSVSFASLLACWPLLAQGWSKREAPHLHVLAEASILYALYSVFEGAKLAKLLSNLKRRMGLRLRMAESAWQDVRLSRKGSNGMIFAFRRRAASIVETEMQPVFDIVNTCSLHVLFGA